MISFHPLMVYFHQWINTRYNPLTAVIISSRFFIVSHVNHWIAASSIGCLDLSVNIYDSVFNSLDSRTIDVIKNHFPSRTICVQSFQKQSGGKDCGLFSIAAITTITYGQDPSDISYIQTEMRKHLLKCFANKIITPFPCQ